MVSRMTILTYIRTIGSPLWDVAIRFLYLALNHQSFAKGPYEHAEGDLSTHMQVSFIHRMIKYLGLKVGYSG